MSKPDKTNVMRILDSKKIPYQSFEYPNEITEGTLVAKELNEDCDFVFKTLVTESSKGENFVFVIPVAQTLDLKAAAQSVGVKSLSMLKQKQLLPLTGYIHGGCSPIGMKKQFKTTIHSSAEALESIYVSAGRVGRQIKISPNDLCRLVNAKFENIIMK